MDVAKFYSLAHLFISLIGGVLLLAIWYNIRRRFRYILEEEDSQKRVDKGLLYLSLAMFVWVASGAWNYLGETLDFKSEISFQVGISLFSILNNLCLLLALFYFYYAPKFIYQQQSNIKKIVVLIIFVAGLTLILARFPATAGQDSLIRYSSLPDLLLSGFLSYLLAVSLYRTFANSGLQVVALISVLVITLMQLSQLPEVFLQLDNQFINSLLKIIAKTSLIAVALVLATTWVIRLASSPKPNEMSIHFLDWSLIKMSIPSKGVYDQTIDFKSKTTQYKNLFKFAIRRKHAEGAKQSIMINAGGEIKSQTYLSRIIDNINEILLLEDEQKLERRDLFTFIGAGKYRLRMIPENISIDKALLEEFTKDTDNQEYKQFCD